MTRTTDDPKPTMISLRISESDGRTLAKLARQWKCSRGEVLRRLLRAAATRKAR